MSNNPQQQTTGTLGLAGLTVNAMALIAPGAFLWLTFQEQSLYGAPMAGCAMWFGILTALSLCFATAISYSELSKIYPGAGSSYLYAEQAFLSKTKAFKFSRIAKFIVGWASHLYYWVYPGVMVGVTAIFCGYMANQFWPNTFSPAYNSPLFMILVCVVFALGVGWIASRGVVGSTGVNTAVNIIQITALIIFTCMAISYRLQHKQGDVAWHLSNGAAITYQVDSVNQLDANNKPIQATWADNTPQVDDKGKPVYKTQDRQVTDDDLKDKTFASLGLNTGDPYPVLQKDAAGKLVLDKDGKPIEVPFTISYLPADAMSGGGPMGAAKDPLTFNYHTSAISVVSPHNFNFLFIQACIAILLIVGFESVTAMGEEAKNPKKDIGRAVILSLSIQAGFCYMFEYFGANFFMNNGYTIGNAGASSAPIGDMMTLVGAWMFGSASAGVTFMWVEAATVFLALIGTTLACINTGARVTYAMGRDKEVGEFFGSLHPKSNAPTKGIWILSVLSIFLGIATVAMYLGGSAQTPLDPKYAHSIWYSFGIFDSSIYGTAVNSLLIMTLISNFGTFLLYGMTCLTAIIAFKEHHTFHGFKHVVVPVFGLMANLGCMLFYIIGPFSVAGMSVKEPYIALAVVFLWSVYGAIHFTLGSKKKEKPIFMDAPATA